MPSKRTFVKHVFGGGWSTDFGPNANVAIQGGQALLPFLVDAQNVSYELDGGPHKIGGTTKLNSSAVESGAVIKGLYDFWISGTGGSSTQKRIIYVNDSIYKDDADGSFDQIKSGLETDKVVNFSTFDDLLLIATDSTTDVPMSWDGSTFQSLSGNPPNFAFSVKHKNRQWASGNAAAPSILYYSVNVDPEDWVGSGSGSIQIDPDDGDRITAIASYKNELWVFKGPYKGSIHRITGSAPTGDDAFARNTFIEGVGAVSQSMVFTYRDDLAFMWSDGTLRSLKATASFGDFNEVALSRPITTWLQDHLNFGRLKHGWAINSSSKGEALLSVAIDGSTNNNCMLSMDYRFEPVRWALWDAFEFGAIAEVIDSASSDRRIVMSGGNDGFVRKLYQSTRSIDGDTAISTVVTTPFLDYGDPLRLKTVSAASCAIAPKNTGNVTFGWQNDNNAQQTQTFTQGGGAALDSFVLGTDVLGGSRFVDRFIPLETGGSFRAIQYQIAHSTNNEDLEFHNIGAQLEGDSESLENG